MWTFRWFFHMRVLILTRETLVPVAGATFGDMDAHRQRDHEWNKKIRIVRSDVPAIAD